LIELLADAGGRVVSREEVVAAVWPEAIEEGVSEQAIDALVRRLRDRLAELDPEREYVMTVRGHGFRLADEPVH
jgi:DNA-binding response OmpR family regulator